ncbi:MAG TPA: helix-turn-helix domain-containing protein [Pseudoduganella sp.]
MKSVKYLEQLREQRGFKTDEELANLLGISRGAVSHYTNGRRIMDDETCIAVAMALDIHPMQVIGAACIDRAEKTGQKSLWEVFMNRGAAVAASVLMAASVNLFLTPAPANAATMRAGEGSGSLEYRLCEVVYVADNVVMSDSGT